MNLASRWQITALYCSKLGVFCHLPSNPLSKKHRPSGPPGEAGTLSSQDLNHPGMRASRGLQAPSPGGRSSESGQRRALASPFGKYRGLCQRCACLLGSWKKAEACFPSQHGSDLLGDLEQGSHRDKDKEGLFLHFHEVWGRAGKRRGGQKGAEGGARGHRSAQSWSWLALASAVPRKLLVKETEAVLPSSASRPGKHKRPGQGQR